MANALPVRHSLLSSCREIEEGAGQEAVQMAHKHTQAQIDAVINQWRGKHAVEKIIAEYDGSKWSKYQRYRMEGGFIFHIATDTLKLTITPPDAKLEAKRAAKVEATLAKEVKSERVIRDTLARAEQRGASVSFVET